MISSVAEPVLLVLDKHIMESDDENLVIALDHLNVDEALPDPEGAGGDEAPGPSLHPANQALMESEWETFQSSIARYDHHSSITDNTLSLAQLGSQTSWISQTAQNPPFSTRRTCSARASL